MAEPKVLDANDREVTEGAQVVHPEEGPSTVIEVRPPKARRSELYVLLRRQGLETGGFVIFAPPSVPCPDLVLLDDNEKEAARDA